MQAKSTVKMKLPRIKQLSQAAVTALEMTAEALHGEIVQAQVIPYDKGTLQGEAFFVDCTDSKDGKVVFSQSTPYARRLYFHPEYDFSTEENPNAKGKWFEDWLPNGRKADFAKKAFGQCYKKVGDV